MNTTQALAEITDAGLFEKIATSVLRYAEPEIYGSVSHQGVNPQGKTVKAPLDNVGWCHTELDETIVCIAHTTTSKSDLEQKWLRDLDKVKPRKQGANPTGTDGDLVKAIKEINEIRKIDPSIKARLALAINCEESQELRTQVQILASNNDIELDIWSVSRLAGFLDTHPDGQIIRRNHFGIAPIRLSKQLLLEIGEKSLSNLKFDAELFIERNFKPVYQNTLVVGVSGTGKTTQSISILKKYLKLQKPVLVLSDSTVNQAVSIKEAVDIELHRYANELIPQSGLQALELCSIDEPLMILVEDINRSSDSTRLLKKLIDWSNSNVNFILLCPVWHRLIASLSFEERKGLEAHFKLEYLESYNEDEANRAVLARATQEKIQLDELSAANIAQQLGYDPLLISLANLAEFHENSNVIAEYVRNTIQSIAIRNDLLAYQVEEAIDEYGLHLFQNKKVQGETRDLRALSQSSQKAFKQILMDGRLFRQAFESPDDAIMSRHDRLNFYIIAKSIVNYLEDDSFDLTDPYFAEIIGISCALAGLKKDKLYDITIKNSLMAFHCYAFSAKTNAAYLSSAINNIKQWLEVSEHQADLYHPQLYQSLIVLNDVLHDSVADILKLYNKNNHNPLFYQISFKQGNLSDGLRWITAYTFEVDWGNEKQVIDYVFNKYGESLVRRVCENLINENINYHTKHQLLWLIGYTENTIFANAVRTAWRFIPDDKKDYHLFFWAAARVCDDDPDSLLESIFDYWESLSDEKNGYMSDRVQFAKYSLEFKFRDYAPNRSINYIIEQAYKRLSLHSSIFSMLKDVDHPEVLEFQADYFSKIEKKDESNFGFTMFTSFFKSADYQVLSNASKEKLLSISNETKDEILRKKTFELWEKSPNDDDLNILKQIPADDIRYKTAIIGRAKRKDFTVIDEFIGQIKMAPEDSMHWWQVARHIWHDKLEQLFENKIANIDDSSNLNIVFLIDEIFERLNIKTAESILIRYWSNLSEKPMFVLIALMIATPRLQKLVSQNLEVRSNLEETFKNLHFTFGFKQENRKGIYRYEQAVAFLPYFSYIDEMYLSNLSEVCLKQGWHDISEILEPLIKEKRWRNYVELDISSLNETLHDNKYFVDNWISDRKKEGWSHEAIVEALFNWFNLHQNDQVLEIISEPLGQSGKRTDYMALEYILQNMDSLSNKEDILNKLYFNIYSRSLE